MIVIVFQGAKNLNKAFTCVRKQDSYSLFVETFTEAVISWPQVQKCERLCLHSHAMLSELSLWHYYSKHFCSGSLVQCNLLTETIQS